MISGWNRIIFSAFVILGVFLPISEAAFAAEDENDASRLPPVSVHEQVINIPGDPVRPVSLQMTIFTPDGTGPFPLAVLNHGATNKKSNSHDEPRYRTTYSAYYFLSRGYAVAMPMMRGFAGSGGEMENDRCDLVTMGYNNAKDIEAVIQYMKTQPYVDGRHIVVSGQSYGGFNTLSYDLVDDPDVKGLINFAGGIRLSSCNSMEESLVSTFGYLGAHSRRPSIWFYGDNDQVFSKPLWQSMYNAFINSGGHAMLVAYGPFMEDSHQLLSFPESLPFWTPRVDSFLMQIGMPSKRLYPAYLPREMPAPSYYADAHDAEAVPYINENGQAMYRRYLDHKAPKVLVIAPSGSAYAQYGGFDPFSRALTLCMQHEKICQPYAVDNLVVWVRPTPAPPPTHYAALNDVNAVPYLTDAGRRDYQTFLTKRRPRAFVVSPERSWSAVWSKAGLANDPIADALAACSKTHHHCQLYAVDNDVVWTK